MYRDSVGCAAGVGASDPELLWEEIDHTGGNWGVVGDA